MPEETREFHIGDILSVTSGLLISLRHVDGIYDLLGWMTRDTLWTHQLPRASDECAPMLREWFPDLAAIEIPAGMNSMDKLTAWFQSIAPEHGSTRMVGRLHPADHTSIDPITEMRMKAPHVQVIPASMPNTE
jgi:hypothetical protein